MEQSSQEPAALDLRMISNAAIQVIITSSLGKLVQYGALISCISGFDKGGRETNKREIAILISHEYEQREPALFLLFTSLFCAGIAGACLLQVI
jgi:hypothetical protein